MSADEVKQKVIRYLLERDETLTRLINSGTNAAANRAARNELMCAYNFATNLKAQ